MERVEKTENEIWFILEFVYPVCLRVIKQGRILMSDTAQNQELSTFEIQKASKLFEILIKLEKRKKDSFVDPKINDSS